MGNPFVHVELNTTDLGAAKSFYQSLFDWTLQDMDIGDFGAYTSISVGDGTGGGMMKHPVPGAPSMWLPYVLVSDVAAATEKARSLGGTVMRDITTIKGMGAFAIVTDPTGAALGLWQAEAR
jgi:predicted enzyme related to lactoylglutathione lyase